MQGPRSPPSCGSATPASRARRSDVSITPDGKYAVARREGAAQVQLIDLGASKVTALDLGSPVTDLDLAASGAFAVAVLRDTSSYVRIAIPGGFTDEAQRPRRQISGGTIGSASLSPDGKTAVFYTTAASEAVKRIVIADLTAAVDPDGVAEEGGARRGRGPRRQDRGGPAQQGGQGDPMEAGLEVDESSTARTATRW